MVLGRNAAGYGEVLGSAREGEGLGDSVLGATDHRPEHSVVALRTSLSAFLELRPALQRTECCIPPPPRGQVTRVCAGRGAHTRYGPPAAPQAALVSAARFHAPGLTNRAASFTQMFRRVPSDRLGKVTSNDRGTSNGVSVVGSEKCFAVSHKLHTFRSARKPKVSKSGVSLQVLAGFGPF